MKYKIGILGAGVMASAILKYVNLSDACVFDICTEKMDFFVSHGATRLPSMKEVVANSDTIFLGIKPQNAAEVFQNCDFSQVKNVISIMAGTKIDSILSKINNKNAGITRVMPNIPAKVGKGVSALCFRNVSAEFQEEVKKIFSDCGTYLVIEENMFDTVTSISGSGPAYVYLFLDALVKGGMDGGLSYDAAKKLAIDLVIGSACFAESEEIPLDMMVESVCSKGGTTIEAVNYYREKDVVGTVFEGIRRCREKSKQLSELTK